ncbi:hypothetical protein BpHYR1_004905 [Brachionus plicatilis]|uniref:Uncharacterized protein n=1 Tax=Brachionus plicatilis TaxID=10195 RepID=A0A3M7RQK0_BRAPC|nr:hypothetical protein BpHYR1_004905 [Brachionus plicatilis]
MSNKDTRTVKGNIKISKNENLNNQMGKFQHRVFFFTRKFVYTKKLFRDSIIIAKAVNLIIQNKKL